VFSIVVVGRTSVLVFDAFIMQQFIALVGWTLVVAIE
jgi:hypothetical protein